MRIPKQGGRWFEGEGGDRESLAHSDDLEDGEENGRRRHRGWERQHGRDVGSYLSGGDHPVKRIVACAASDSPESHEEWQVSELSCPGRLT